MSGFDALTHLDSPRYEGVLDQVVSQARAAGVTGWLVAGADPARWDRVRAVAAHTDAAWAIGAHPWWTGTADGATRGGWLAALDALDPPVLGEIGLDHHRARSDAEREAQRHALRDQLAWARVHDRPVVLHVVRALPEVLTLLRKDGLPRAGGLIHGWYGPADQVPDAIELGLHLSFGPALLHPTGHKVRQSFASTPPGRRLLETDCPDQAFPGVGLSGPFHLTLLARAAATLIGTHIQHVLDETGDAARTLLWQAGSTPSPHGSADR